MSLVATQENAIPERQLDSAPQGAGTSHLLTPANGRRNFAPIGLIRSQASLNAFSEEVFDAFGPHDPLLGFSTCQHGRRRENPGAGPLSLSVLRSRWLGELRQCARHVGRFRGAACAQRKEGSAESGGVLSRLQHDQGAQGLSQLRRSKSLRAAGTRGVAQDLGDARKGRRRKNGNISSKVAGRARLAFLSVQEVCATSVVVCFHKSRQPTG